MNVTSVSLAFALAKDCCMEQLTGKKSTQSGDCFKDHNFFTIDVDDTYLLPRSGTLRTLFVEQGSAEPGRSP